MQKSSHTIKICPYNRRKHTFFAPKTQCPSRQRFLWTVFTVLAAASIFFLPSCKSIPQAELRIEEPDSSQEKSGPSEEELLYARTHFADGSALVTAETAFSHSDTLLCTFAGDLMAHKPNWSKGHFDEIYKDIAPFLAQSDFSFANMETPVTNSLPYDTYPEFNVHGEYVQAAIDAGFNVFSLANNHTNDKLLQGIRETKAWFDAKRTETAHTERPVYAAGLKETSGGPLTYQLLQKDGWTILFVAVTEILNRPQYASYIDFINPTKKNRAAFAETLAELRAEHPCDLFVASIHCAEPEYVLSVEKAQKDFYYDLLEHSVDVVWVNHPHVAKPWEVICDDEQTPRKMIFYSMGNSISAQRSVPNWAKPSANREYTGEGYMAQVRFLRDASGKISIAWVNPLLLTTYITPDGLFVIKRLTDTFIDDLFAEGHLRWANYLEERKKLMDTIQGTTVWQ